MNTINDAIIKTIKELKTFSRGTKGGHKLEDLIANSLNNNLKDFSYIDERIFKEHYSEYKKICSDSIESYNFKDVILKSGYKDDNLIVVQPRGSQASPDILIIHNKIGLVIECKTGKDDKITWNSGYPRKGFIYVFNKYNGNKTGTTFFLGEDIISDFEIEKLLDQAKKNQKDSKNFNAMLYNEHGSEWSIYARPMFNSKTKFFNNDNIMKKRENNVIEYIKNYKWL